MVEFDFSGAFVNPENTSDNEIFTVVAVPVPEEKQHPTEKVMINGVMKPKTFMVLNMQVDKGNGTKTYTPDNKTGLRFNQSWGKDYTQWVGKKFSVKIEAYKAFGADKKRCAGFPLVSENK